MKTMIVVAFGYDHEKHGDYVEVLGVFSSQEAADNAISKSSRPESWICFERDIDVPVEEPKH